MRASRKLFCFALVLLIPSLLSAAGLSPWQFGMTKEQVASFKQFDPYKSFSNGDLETYNGVYRSHKGNVQFFFQNDRLRRIGVYLYEGKDKEKAIQAFSNLYQRLEKDYGKIDMPLNMEIKAKQINADVLAIGAAVNAFAIGKTEMRPRNQHGDIRIFGAIISDHLKGGDTFFVAVFLDPR